MQVLAVYNTYVCVVLTLLPVVHPKKKMLACWIDETVAALREPAMQPARCRKQKDVAAFVACGSESICHGADGKD